MDKIPITICKFNNKFILKVGNKYHEEKQFDTYIEAKKKVDYILEKYGKDYEFGETI